MTGRSSVHHLLCMALLLPALLAPAGPARAAAGVILNTLQGFDDHVPGWSGSVDGLYSGAGGNTERLIFAVSGRVQWRGERNRWQLRASWGYEESDGRKTAQNAIAHLRHNFDITNTLATIAFIQVQENPFQRIESRWLLGLGLRGDIIDDDTGTLLVGITPMFEVERIEGEDRTERARLSTFLFLSRSFAARVRVDATGFYQPLFEDASNYRTVGTVTLVVGLTGSLDLKIGGSTETNSRPASGVEKTDWTTFTSLALSL